MDGVDGVDGVDAMDGMDARDARDARDTRDGGEREGGGESWVLAAHSAGCVQDLVLCSRRKRTVLNVMF